MDANAAVVYATSLISALFAGVMAAAAITKIASPRGFAASLTEALRPVVVSTRSGRLLSGIELLAAIAFSGLVGPILAGISGAALAVALLTIGMLGLIRKTTLPCGCFGGSSKHPYGWRSIGWGAIALALAVLRAMVARAGGASAPLSWIVLVTAIGAVGACEMPIALRLAKSGRIVA